MEELKKAALDTIEENKELIASVADQIWEYAELSLQEVRSAALYCKVLKEQGFAVEEGVCSISTAFVASYGSGRPIIGILAEYDALSGLSQLGGSTQKQELTPVGPAMAADIICWGPALWRRHWVSSIICSKVVPLVR